MTVAVIHRIPLVGHEWVKFSPTTWQSFVVSPSLSKSTAPSRSQQISRESISEAVSPTTTLNVISSSSKIGEFPGKPVIVGATFEIITLAVLVSDFSPSSSQAATLIRCSPEVGQATDMVDEGPFVVSVQLESRCDGNHSILRLSMSLSVSSPVIRNNTTWSSSKYQVPFASRRIFCPAFHNSGTSRVGAIFRTSNVLFTEVTVPSSSIASATIVISPSAIGMKVQVG